MTVNYQLSTINYVHPFSQSGCKDRSKILYYEIISHKNQCKLRFFYLKKSKTKSEVINNIY